MVCSKCGKEIPSEMMFCPECGSAIQMVPDFDVNIDEGIAVSSDEVKEALDKLLDSDGNRRISEDTVKLPAVREKVKVLRNAAIVTSVALLLVIVLLIGFSFARTDKDSMENFISEARISYEAGDYPTAVSRYESALLIAREEDSMIEINDQIALADSLHNIGRSDDAVSVLKGITILDPENYSAYELLINILKSQGKYEDINKLVAGTTDEYIYSKFEGYLTMPPDFQTAAGSYNEEFDLVLSTEYDADIYYTLDGSKPDSSSNLYMEPLHIGEGDTVVTAVCINGYDMASPEVSMKYTVEFDRPLDPEVTPDSGSFSQPKYISLTVSDPNTAKVYYTTDGTDPNEASEIYEHQLPMMLGKNTFKFLPVSDKGVSGNVVEREYNLAVQGLCTSEDATNYVAASLVATGALLDIYGNIPGVKGHYKYLCTKAAREGSRTYYIVDEYFEDPNGILKQSENAYAVDVISCMLYRVAIKPDGRYGFTLFY